MPKMDNHQVGLAENEKQMINKFTVYLLQANVWFQICKTLHWIKVLHWLKKCTIYGFSPNALSLYVLQIKFIAVPTLGDNLRPFVQ